MNPVGHIFRQRIETEYNWRKGCLLERPRSCRKSLTHGIFTLNLVLTRTRGAALMGLLAGSVNYQMLFHTFGAYDANAPTSGRAFSHLKEAFFDPLFRDDSFFLVKRTSVPMKQMSWRVSGIGSWRSMHLPDVSSMRLTRDGTTYRTFNPISIFQRGCAAPCYIGKCEMWHGER